MLQQFHFSQKNPSSKSAKEPSKSPRYKIIEINSKWEIVPRESTIREILKPFINHILAKREFILRPYGGIFENPEYESASYESSDDSDINSDSSNTESSSSKTIVMDVDKVIDPRVIIAQTVSQLPIFSYYRMIPNMKNGHTRDNRKTNIERGYTLEKSFCTPIGCIFFEIVHNKNYCIIHCLGVDESEQGKGIGTILTLIAILIASLYGVERIKLLATQNSFQTYFKTGFFVKDDWQDYTNANNKELNKLFCDYCNLQTISLQLLMQHPGYIRAFSQSFKKYFDKELDLGKNIEQFERVSAKKTKEFSQICSLLEKLKQSFNANIAQRWLSLVEHFSEEVKLPEEIMNQFHKLISLHQYQIKDYQLVPLKPKPIKNISF